MNAVMNIKKLQKALNRRTGSVPGEKEEEMANYSMEYANQVSLDTYYDFHGNNNMFAKLERLLASGDKCYRCSSDAYLEIKRDVRNMDELLSKAGDNLSANTELKCRLIVISNSIIDKADKYISDREEVEKKYDENSYKGKRVRIMRELRNNLRARLMYIDIKKFFTVEELNNPIPEGYLAVICESLKTSTFSPALYREYLALTSCDKKTLKELFAYRNEVNSWEAFKLMSKTLQGEKHSLSELTRYFSLANNRLAITANYCRAHSCEENSNVREACVNRINAINMSELGLGDIKNSSSEDDHNPCCEGKLTDNKALDRDIFNSIIKIIDSYLKSYVSTSYNYREHFCVVIKNV